MRTYLVVIDDGPESAIALRFAARRAAKTGGGVEILALVPPQEFIAFGAVQATIEDEAREQAEAMVEQAAGALVAEGVRPSIIVRGGDAPTAVREVIAANPDIAALVLGAAASGPPGPLVTYFSSADVGRLSVPIMIVPGSLDEDAIDRLS